MRTDPSRVDRHCQREASMSRSPLIFPICSSLLLLLAIGCDDKKAKTTAGGSAVGATADAEAQAVLALETHQDLAQCRTVLQQLDNLPSVASRPTLSATDL